MTGTEIEHKGQATRSLSPAIWGDLPLDLWSRGMGGVFLYDDFLNFAKHNSAQQTQQYASYIDTGVTIQQASDVATLPKLEWGVAKVTHDGTANDEASLQMGGNTAGIFAVPAAPAAGIDLACECRMKKSSVADSGPAFFFGLATPGLAAADTLVDTTCALRDSDFLGFRVLADNGEELDFVFKKAGQTVVEVIAALASLSADTYFKIGFRVDTREQPSKRIKAFYNGTVVTTAYITEAMMALATFPADVLMHLLFASKIVTGSAFTTSLDWWAVGQGMLNG